MGSPELTVQWEKCNNSHAWHKIWNTVILLGAMRVHGQVGYPYTRIVDNLRLTLTFTRSRSSPHSYPVTLMLYLCIIMQRLTNVVETSSLRNLKISSEIPLSCFFYQVFQEDTAIVPEHKRRPFPPISVSVHHWLSYALSQVLCSWHTLIFLLLWFSLSIPTCAVY